MKFYLLSKNDIHPILWDGRAKFEPPPGTRVLSEEQFKAWVDSPDGKTPPPDLDPVEDRAELDIETLKYVKRKATPEEKAEAAQKAEKQQLRTILVALKAGNATGPQIQRVLAFVLEKIV